MSSCEFVIFGVCVSLASPTPLGLELVEARESSRPRDNPSGLFPYKTYGKMQKLFSFSAHNSY